MSYLQQRLQLFANQPFRWYAFSCILAAFGNGLAYITSAWLALDFHNSVTAVAMLMLSFWVPYIVFSPFGGVLADRFSRKQIMVWANMARTLLLFGLGWLALGLKSSAIILYLINGTLGLAVAAYLPATLALVPLIVPSNQLLHANATADLVYEAGNVIGMGSAGIFIALFSVKTTFAISAAIFFLATFCSIMINYQRRAPIEEQRRFNVLVDFYDGMKYLSGKRMLLFLYVIQVLLLIDFMTAPVLLPPFVRDVLHANAAQFGQIEAGLSVGIIIGSMVTPFLADRWNMRKVVLCELSVLTLCFAAFCLVDRLIEAGILYLIMGFCLSAWPVLVTQTQERTETYFQGRLQSNFISLAGVFAIMMFAVISFFSHYLRINDMYWFHTTFTLVAVYLAWRFCPID